MTKGVSYELCIFSTFTKLLEVMFSYRPPSLDAFFLPPVYICAVILSPLIKYHIRDLRSVYRREKQTVMLKAKTLIHYFNIYIKTVANFNTKPKRLQLTFPAKY